MPLERPCPGQLERICGGERLYLSETFNWPDGGVTSIDPYGVDPFVICRSSEPSSCEVLENGAELVGRAGIYHVGG